MKRKGFKKICITLVAVLLVTLLAVPVFAEDDINKTTIRLRGNTYSLVTEYSRSYTTRSRLYQQTSTGKKVVAATQYSGDRRMEFVGTYGNKMYFNYADGPRIRMYTYTVGGKGFKLENKSLYLEGIRGKYAYGYTRVPEDNTPRKLCIYNLATRKSQSLGLGYFSDSNYIDGRVYYVRYVSRYKKANIMSCNPSGSGKKVHKKLQSKYGMFSFDMIEKHKAHYYIDVRNNYRSKTVRY